MYANDKVVIAQSDTIIELPIYVDYYITNNNNWASNFYKNIQRRAYTNRWTKELHNVILVPEDSSKRTENVVAQKIEVPFLPYKNMVIRKIRIEKLDVFGPTMNNPNQQTRTLMGTAGNKLHIKTKDEIIKDHLIIKVGEKIDPNALAENERILRELPYIEDARIIIENTNSFGDSADIIIITKDRFSVGFNLNINKGESQYLDVYDKNMFGTGQEFENTFYRTPYKKPASGIEGMYLIRNIAGSFINCKLGYDAYGAEGYNISLARDFFTQRTKYAGDFSFIKKNSFTPLNDQWIPLNANYTNFWIGRAFALNLFGLDMTRINNLIVSSGVYDRRFSKGPETATNYMYQFQQSTYYLGSIAFSSQSYLKSNLVYSFGKTEDIPYGFLINYTHGYELNQYKNRLYNSVSVSKGDIISNAGYLYGNIAFGGFSHHDKFEQGILKFNTSFFTNLLVIKNLKVRHFINISFVKGYDRYKDEVLTVNNMSGIRGFINDSAKGTQKLIFNFESVFFTPFYVFGFRIATFVFADLGWVGESYKPIFDNAMYSGYGLGLRVRNEKLVFNTIQIRFAYYPNLTHQAHGEFFTISEQSKFRPSGFSVKSPEIIGFK